MLKKSIVLISGDYREFFELFKKNDIEEMKHKGYQEITIDEEGRFKLGERILNVQEHIEPGTGIKIEVCRVVYKGDIVYLFGDSVRIVFCGDGGLSLHKAKEGP